MANEEDDAVEAYHGTRRMFCIHQGKLVVAEPNLPYSHSVWFEKEGWMTKDDDGLMEEMTRGAVYSNGDVYIYTGYDFQINDRVEETFFPHLKELSDVLHLRGDAEVYGGLIRSEPGKTWPPAKKYGKIEDNLKG